MLHRSILKVTKFQLPPLRSLSTVVKNILEWPSCLPSCQIGLIVLCKIPCLDATFLGIFPPQSHTHTHTHTHTGYLLTLPVPSLLVPTTDTRAGPPAISKTLGPMSLKFCRLFEISLNVLEI